MKGKEGQSIAIVGDGSRRQATGGPRGQALLQQRDDVTIFRANNVTFLTADHAATT